MVRTLNVPAERHLGHCCCCLGYTSGNVFQTIAQEDSDQYVDLHVCDVFPC